MKVPCSGNNAVEPLGWLEAIVITSAGHREDVESALNYAGALAVTLRDAGNRPLLEPTPGATPGWPQTEVIGLFPECTDPDRLRACLGRALAPEALAGYRHRRLAERDWQREGLKDFVPLTFGGRLCVCPTHLSPPGDFQATVWLDPGLAFGTGTHASTSLCLEALAGLELAGQKLLDYGCGSGILSLAALKLGAVEAWAVDHDPQALAATRANAERNAVGERLRAVPSGEPLGVRADVVVANILADTLIALAPTLAALAAPGARLLLSGILADQASAVRRAYQPAFGRWRTRRRDDWVLLGARRSSL